MAATTSDTRRKGPLLSSPVSLVAASHTLNPIEPFGRVSLWQTITTAREGYLAAYRATLRQKRGTLMNLCPEVLVRPHGVEQIPAVYATFRVDLMWGDERSPEVGKLDADHLVIEGPPRVIQCPDGSRLSIESFAWDQCELHLSPPLMDDTALREWCLRWMDRAESNPPDEDGLHSVVHAVAPPDHTRAGETSLFVDLGSAVPDAFTSLLSVLVAGGPRSIRVNAAARGT